MDVIAYTREWLQGEMLLGDGLMIFGGLTLIAVVLLFFFGTSDNARSMILPGFIAAVLTLVGGYLMTKFSLARIEEYSSPMSLLNNEMTRVDNFIPVYKWSAGACGVLILIAVSLMIFFKKSWIRGCGIAVLYLGVVLTVTDIFSSENGTEYQAQLHQLYEETSFTAQNNILIEQPVEIVEIP